MSLKAYNQLSFGNMLEGYSLSLTIFFASFIANDFFPHSGDQMKVLLVFSTFFIGSLARPIGGVFGGWLADKFSGAAIVNYCVVTIGVTSLLMAVLPSYQRVGLFAPLLLILLRIIQGLASGGLLPNLIAISINQCREQSAMAIGMSFSVSTLGFLLASLVGFVLTQYFPSLSSSMMWRIGFVASGFLFMVYLWLNWANDYSQLSGAKEAKLKPVLKAMTEQSLAIFSVILLTIMCSTVYYLLYTYLLNHQILILDYKHEHAFLINSLILVIACIGYPLFGAMADKIGCSRLCWMAMTGFLVAVVPCIELIHHPSLYLAFSALYLLVLLSAAIQASVSPLFAGVFSSAWRATGCAFSFGIGNAIGGGAPLFALAIVNQFPDYGLAFMLVSLLLLGCIGILWADSRVNHQTESMTRWAE